MTDADLYPIAIALCPPSPRWVVSVDIRAAIVAGVGAVDVMLNVRWSSGSRTVVRFSRVWLGCALALGVLGCEGCSDCASAWCTLCHALVSLDHSILLRG